MEVNEMKEKLRKIDEKFNDFKSRVDRTTEDTNINELKKLKNEILEYIQNGFRRIEINRNNNPNNDDNNSRNNSRKNVFISNNNNDSSFDNSIDKSFDNNNRHDIRKNQSFVDNNSYNSSTNNLIINKSVVDINNNASNIANLNSQNNAMETEDVQKYTTGDEADIEDSETEMDYNYQYQQGNTVQQENYYQQQGNTNNNCSNLRNDVSETITEGEDTISIEDEEDTGDNNNRQGKRKRGRPRNGITKKEKKNSKNEEKGNKAPKSAEDTKLQQKVVDKIQNTSALVGVRSRKNSMKK